MAGPQQVLRYLGRYTHRIAISNERLIEHRDDRVTFGYKDRADGGKRKSKTIPGTEFTRRFLLHVVPERFVRVRHYGLLANGIKSSRLARARLLLGAPVPPEPPQQASSESWQDTYCRILGSDPLLCPACRVGRLASMEVIRPPAELACSAPTSRSP